MNHFNLVNDLGYESVARKSEFDFMLVNKEFSLQSEERNASSSCLCSHGSDECWHAGRGSK
jgi:hypothetical protein